MVKACCHFSYGFYSKWWMCKMHWISMRMKLSFFFWILFSSFNFVCFFCFLFLIFLSYLFIICLFFKVCIFKVEGLLMFILLLSSSFFFQIIDYGVGITHNSFEVPSAWSSSKFLSFLHGFNKKKVTICWLWC